MYMWSVQLKAKYFPCFRFTKLCSALTWKSKGNIHIANQRRQNISGTGIKLVIHHRQSCHCHVWQPETPGSVPLTYSPCCAPVESKSLWLLFHHDCDRLSNCTCRGRVGSSSWDPSGLLLHPRHTCSWDKLRRTDLELHDICLTCR